MRPTASVFSGSMLVLFPGEGFDTEAVADAVVGLPAINVISEHERHGFEGEVFLEVEEVGVVVEFAFRISPDNDRQVVVVLVKVFLEVCDGVHSQFLSVNSGDYWAWNRSTPLSAEIRMMVLTARLMLRSSSARALMASFLKRRGALVGGVNHLVKSVVRRHEERVDESAHPGIVDDLDEIISLLDVRDLEGSASVAEEIAGLHEPDRCWLDGDGVRISRSPCRATGWWACLPPRPTG
nr:MAG TPA: hypothetical protein [Caudoviricetes sp.]